ncbi:MAG TPA: SGNH/GDSL hydrolase family protein [Terrimicrobiaceae bacterium]|nr:SGNH/GDSL hydrolase family protein [Terrimicrobiaceae bacterium]
MIAIRRSVLALTVLFAASVLASEPQGETMNEGETVSDAAVSKNPAMRPIEDVPGLPRVLLIGDSISIGYTTPVRDLLKGKANVHRIPNNGQSTAIGLLKLDRWLGDTKWDVIHFNFGVHDAKYLTETETKVSRADYEKNLRELVKRLRATGAKLVFATTTPVPAVLEPPTRRFDSIPERNAIAVRVMQENGVVVDDLYAVVLPQQEQLQRPKDVHFLPAGSDLLARAVAASIETELPKTGTSSGGMP